MKKIFLYLLRRYSTTEKQRMEIYKELWDSTRGEYNEGTAFDNVCNMHIEMLIANPFFESRVVLGADDHLTILKERLRQSFDESVHISLKENLN